MIKLTGKKLELVKRITNNSQMFFNARTINAKTVTFDGWRADAINAYLKEIAKEDKQAKKEEVEEETPIYQAEILDKNHKPADEGWIWIKFAGIPNEEIRKALKENGYRFTSKHNGKWYNINNATNLDTVHEILKPFYNL